MDSGQDHSSNSPLVTVQSPGDSGQDGSNSPETSQVWSQAYLLVQNLQLYHNPDQGPTTILTRVHAAVIRCSDQPSVVTGLPLGAKPIA